MFVLSCALISLVCLPGTVQRPARDVDPDTVIESVRLGLSKTGYNEFSLLSLSCSDWLSLPAVGLNLKNEFQKYNISLSLGSQRVDRFDESIAHVAGGLRKSGLTFAPEAGTQRMRDVSAPNCGLPPRITDSKRTPGLTQLLSLIL